MLRAIGSGNRPMDSLKGALKTPPGMWIPYPCVGLSVLQRAKISARSFSKAHPGAAGKSHELQVRRKNVQGADRTLDHVTIDFSLNLRLFFVLIG